MKNKVMKANEVPEKIYLQENTTTDCYGEFWPEWFEARAKDSDIEYTRTDAFIEKAIDYIANNMRCDGYTLQTKAKFIKGFKKYMEGE